MINVLHVADKLTVGNSTIHGVTRLLSWLLPRFDRNRFCLSVCSLRGRDRAGQYLEERGIKVIYLNKGKFDPRTVTKLMKVIKKESVDILHLHGYGAWTFGRIAGLLCRIPALVQEHMIDTNIPMYQRFVDRCLASTTAHSIAVSESVKDFMIRYRAIPKGHVEVIRNGLPLDYFQSGNGSEGRKMFQADLRDKLNIPSTHKIVGTVGRLHSVKGHRYFLEAAREVIKQYQSVTFLVIGDGELRESLEEMTRVLGIKRYVRFTGHCENIVPLYSLMDIFVIASISEGGPITLFEAMATGCAIVSTDTIGLKDVIENGRTGFLVPAGDVAAIANRIGLLLGNDNRLREMKVATRKVSTTFDIAETIVKIENCYDRVLAVGGEGYA